MKNSDVKTMSLLEAINAATEEDLAAVEAEIAELQGQIKTRLASLKMTARLIRTRLRGAPPRKSPQRKQKAATGPGLHLPIDGSPAGTKWDIYRRRAAEYLLRAGNARQSTICEQCQIPPGSGTPVLEHPWFEKSGDGIRLTMAGKREVG